MAMADFTIIKYGHSYKACLFMVHTISIYFYFIFFCSALVTIVVVVRYFGHSLVLVGFGRQSDIQPKEEKTTSICIL